jgi:hypothetical protein
VASLAVSLDASNVEGLRQQANAAWMLGRLDEAEMILRHALTIVPEHLIIIQSLSVIAAEREAQ